MPVIRDIEPKFVVISRLSNTSSTLSVPFAGSNQTAVQITVPPDAFLIPSSLNDTAIIVTNVGDKSLLTSAMTAGTEFPPMDLSKFLLSLSVVDIRLNNPSVVFRPNATVSVSIAMDPTKPLPTRYCLASIPTGGSAWECVDRAPVFNSTTQQMTGKTTHFSVFAVATLSTPVVPTTTTDPYGGVGEEDESKPKYTVIIIVGVILIVAFVLTCVICAFIRRRNRKATSPNSIRNAMAAAGGSASAGGSSSDPAARRATKPVLSNTASSERIADGAAGSTSSKKQDGKSSKPGSGSKSSKFAGKEDFTKSSDDDSDSASKSSSASSSAVFARAGALKPSSSNLDRLREAEEGQAAPGWEKPKPAAAPLTTNALTAKPSATSKPTAATAKTSASRLVGSDSDSDSKRSGALDLKELELEEIDRPAVKATASASAATEQPKKPAPASQGWVVTGKTEDSMPDPTQERLTLAAQSLSAQSLSARGSARTGAGAALASGPARGRTDTLDFNDVDSVDSEFQNLMNDGLNSDAASMSAEGSETPLRRKFPSVSMPNPPSSVKRKSKLGDDNAGVVPTSEDRFADDSAKKLDLASGAQLFEKVDTPEKPAETASSTVAGASTTAGLLTAASSFTSALADRPSLTTRAAAAPASTTAATSSSSAAVTTTAAPPASDSESEGPAAPFIPPSDRPNPFDDHSLEDKPGSDDPNPFNDLSHTDSEDPGTNNPFDNMPDDEHNKDKDENHNPFDGDSLL